jgi:hypothetical protein
MVENMTTAFVAKVEATFRNQETKGVKANTLNVHAMERLIGFIDSGQVHVAEDYWHDHLIAVASTLFGKIDTTIVVDSLEWQ